MQSWHSFNLHQESKMLLHLPKLRIKHQGLEVPYNLTDSEKLKYGNKSKMHSQHIATLKKHCGNVYALIYGQCAQILQENMKQDKNWATVSVSYKLLELYKLIE